MKNKFIYLKQSSDLVVDIKSDLTINILAIADNDMQINVLADVANQAHFTINLVCLATKTGSLKVMVTTNSKQENTNIKVNVNAIANQQAQIQLKLNAIVEHNILNTIVEQKIKGLLLSDNCSIMGVPELTINTDAIIATHALSIGGIDKEELFYLMSKGLDEQTCKQIIIDSYLMLIFKQMNSIKKNWYYRKINKILKKEQQNEKNK